MKYELSNYGENYIAHAGGYKYTRREPKPGGGYTYYYDDASGKTQQVRGSSEYAQEMAYNDGGGQPRRNRVFGRDPKSTRTTETSSEAATRNTKERNERAARFIKLSDKNVYEAGDQRPTSRTKIEDTRNAPKGSIASQRQAASEATERLAKTNHFNTAGGGFNASEEYIRNYETDKNPSDKYKRYLREYGINHPILAREKQLEDRENIAKLNANTLNRRANTSEDPKITNVARRKVAYDESQKAKEAHNARPSVIKANAKKKISDAIPDGLKTTVKKKQRSLARTKTKLSQKGNRAKNAISNFFNRG